MEPFIISSSLAKIPVLYPKVEEIRKVLREGVQEDRILIARQWLSEGIPYAFKKCPAIYESMRSWLSTRLGVDAKGISLIGSARLGWSLSPGEKLGKKFHSKSDLDLFIVSGSLFTAMCDDFNCWRSDFQTNKISPRNNREKYFWGKNEKRGPKIIDRGFMDSKIIPTYGGYDKVRINKVMSDLKIKINATKHVEDICHASLRCYKSWSSWEDQALINLNEVAKNI